MTDKARIARPGISFGFVNNTYSYPIQMDVTGKGLYSQKYYFTVISLRSVPFRQSLM